MGSLADFLEDWGPVMVAIRGVFANSKIAWEIIGKTIGKTMGKWRCTRNDKRLHFAMLEDPQFRRGKSTISIMASIAMEMDGCSSRRRNSETRKANFRKATATGSAALGSVGAVGSAYCGSV